MMRFHRCLATLLAAVSLLCCGPLGGASAQGLPSGNITVIVPFAPGGFVEIAARVLEKEFKEKTGQSLVLDFRPGGGGTVGVMAFKQVAPDGRTLFMGTPGTHVVNPIIDTVPYDPIADFEPITTIVYTPTVFVVPASSPAKTLADLVKLGSSKSGGLSYGSAGVGSGSHIIGELLATATGQKMTHIPYRGAGPMIVDLVEGRLDFTSTSYSAVKGQVDENRLRPLAVPSKVRFAQLPDVPTTAEAGYPTLVDAFWTGLFAPAGTPPATVRAFSEVFNDILKNPAANKMFVDRGLIPLGNTPAQFKDQILSETGQMKELAKTVNFKP